MAKVWIINNILGNRKTHKILLESLSGLKKGLIYPLSQNAYLNKLSGFFDSVLLPGCKVLQETARDWIGRVF